MTASYQIAGRLSAQERTPINAQSHFARCIGDAFAQFRPTRIIETGTYLGTGTTAIIARALRQLAIADARFYSIEVDPRHAERAVQNLRRAGLSVGVVNGLSLPREVLPTIEQIERQYVRTASPQGLVVDHEEADRAARYHRETDFPDLPDDILGRLLASFDYRPDFLLLDSGEHIGHLEFRYVIDRLRGPCLIALHDIHHVKHLHSFRDLRTDDRFELVAASEEKFGFCIARFNP